jgi:ATP-binding cassette subfamily B protein
MTRTETILAGARLLRPHRRLFALLLLVTGVEAFLGGVADPLATKLLIDSLGRGDVRFFLGLAVLLMVLYTLLRLLNLGTTLMTQRLKNQISRDSSLAMFDTFYTIPYAEVARREKGYFISRIYDEPAQSADVVGVSTRAFSAAAMFTGALLVCLWLSWQVALILSGLVPILLYLSERYGARIRTTAVQEKEDEAKLRETLGRAVESYRNVHLFGLHRAVRHTVGLQLGRYLAQLYTRIRYVSVFQAISGSFLSYAELAVLIAVGYQVLQGHLSIGGLFGFVAAYWRVVNSVRTLSSLVPAAARLGGQLARLQEFQALGRSSHGAAGQDGSSIEVHGAWLDMGARTVLKDLSLSIRKGDRVLIRGPNGSGKSTLLHLLCGFLEPGKGAVRRPTIDRVSALLLPPGFIPGDLRENAGYANLSPSRRGLFDRLLREFGLEGRDHQDPASLSEGERKKFQTLLALLKDADFYLLDEPLANVDSASKEGIMRAILEATRGRALVVVMHGEESYDRRFTRVIALDHSPHAEFVPPPGPLDDRVAALSPTPS